MPAENPAANHTLDLALTGMTCAACAARIEKTLNRLPGVSANVNFATEKAHATVSAGVTVETLLIAVEPEPPVFEHRPADTLEVAALVVIVLILD